MEFLLVLIIILLGVLHCRNAQGLTLTQFMLPHIILIAVFVFIAAIMTTFAHDAYIVEYVSDRIQQIKQGI